MPTKVLGDPDELDRHLVECGYAESLAPPPPEPALVDRYEDRYVYRRGGSGVDIELLVSLYLVFFFLIISSKKYLSYATLHKDLN